MPVSFNDVFLAFEFANASSDLGGSQAFVCRQSGGIYCHSDLLEDDADDELPEDIEDEEKYAQIPTKRELDLGRRLALDFARQTLPGEFEDVSDMFNRKGAYANFKHLLARKQILEQWYDFEQKATERALRDWCELNSIELAD